VRSVSFQNDTELRRTTGARRRTTAHPRVELDSFGKRIHGIFGDHLDQPGSHHPIDPRRRDDAISTNRYDQCLPTDTELGQTTEARATLIPLIPKIPKIRFKELSPSTTRSGRCAAPQTLPKATTVHVSVGDSQRILLMILIVRAAATDRRR
jgi:hypothetical protein